MTTQMIYHSVAFVMSAVIPCFIYVNCICVNVCAPMLDVCTHGAWLVATLCHECRTLRYSFNRVAIISCVWMDEAKWTFWQTNVWFLQYPLYDVWLSAGVMIPLDNL